VVSTQRGRRSSARAAAQPVNHAVSSLAPDWNRHGVIHWYLNPADV
jgi:hypothetical protein